MLFRKRLAQTLALLTTCASVSATHGITTYSDSVLANNPNAYWQFEDENVASGAADSALGNGAQNGVYTGNASLNPNGAVGQSMQVTPANPIGGWMQASNVQVGNTSQSKPGSRPTPPTTPPTAGAPMLAKPMVSLFIPIVASNPGAASSLITLGPSPP